MWSGTAWKRFPTCEAKGNTLAPDDVLRAYDLQVSCYVTKPSDLDEFERVMQTIRDFTLTVVKLPPRDPPSRPEGPAGGLQRVQSSRQSVLTGQLITGED
jgi:hypothetical protein